MKEYHKINTLFKRDINNKGKIIENDWSLPELEFLKENRWIFTEKVDGTNIRIKWEGGGMSLGGKTDHAEIPTALINAIQAMNLSQKFKEHFPDKDVCFYGEGYGAKIQKGECYRSDQSFVLFDIKVGQWWLSREDVETKACSFGIDIVPIVGEGTLYDAINLVKGGFKSRWGDFVAEGIVARPATELRTRDNSRIITKIKYKDFVAC